MERTLVLLKPDAIQRGLVGEIITRLERKGLALVGLRMLEMANETLEVHYAHLADKPFFTELKQFMKSTPVIAVCVEGVDAVETVRRLAGITLSREADPGTIRGDLAMSVQCNLVHASDSLVTAEAELARFFGPDELFSFDRVLHPLIYAAKERRQQEASPSQKN